MGKPPLTPELKAGFIGRYVTVIPKEQVKPNTFIVAVQGCYSPDDGRLKENGGDISVGKAGTLATALRVNNTLLSSDTVRLSRLPYADIAQSPCPVKIQPTAPSTPETIPLTRTVPFSQ